LVVNLFVLERVTHLFLTEPRKYFQKTLAKETSFEDQGLFTGQKAQIRLIPQPPNTGILFQRIDLKNKPIIPATLSNVKDAVRCTLLEKDSAVVQTPEHLLSAIFAFGVDNLLIEISGPEVPILDGSALPFFEMLEKAGLEEQSEKKDLYVLQKPIYYSHEEVQIVAIPSESFQISYTLHYPHSQFLGTQFLHLKIDSSYKQTIAPARTFCLYDEIQPFLNQGVIKGGGLHNALIIKENEILNPEGMRFSDEPVRHKILDLVGDLSLIGNRFLAHVIAIRSGHKGNASFAKLLEKMMMENLDAQLV